MRRFLGCACSLFLVLALVSPFGCNKKGEKKEEKKETKPAAEPAKAKFEVTSSAFENDLDIPAKHAGSSVPGGENVSIPLKWKNAPDDTKSFAITMVDTAEMANNFLHWLVINIPADTTSIEEGASGQNMPSGSTELKNDFGEEGYDGPAPPKDSGEHDYVITVYALSIPSMGMTENAGLSEFESFIKGKVLGKAVISGEFSQE